MKYKIVKGDRILLKDIQERLDDEIWVSEECEKEIMLVPFGIIRKNGRIEVVLNTDTNLIK